MSTGFYERDEMKNKQQKYTDNDEEPVNDAIFLEKITKDAGKKIKSLSDEKEFLETLMDYYTDKDITVNEHNIIKCVLRQLHYLQKLKRGKSHKHSSSLGSRKEIRGENY